MALVLHRSRVASVLRIEPREVASASRELDARRLALEFATYYGDLVAFAAARLECVDDAEDLVASVFLRVLLMRDAPVLHESPRSYLFAAVANQLRDWRAHADVRKRADERIASGDGGYASASRVESTDARVLYGELEARVTRVVQQLPPRRRLIFVLSREHGLSYPEIARMLGIAETTVKTQVGRVMEDLAQALQDWGPWGR